MTALDAYKHFLLKINKNDTNRNIRINKGNFVFIYNQEIDKWLANQIEDNNDSSEKNKIEELLIHDEPLEKIVDKDNVSEFDLPIDFFEYESSYSIASKGKCKNRVLYNWDFKTKNKNVLFQNENNNPSFEYEQTLVNPSQNKLLVFKDGFDVDKQYLTYYRRPTNIDLEGYVRTDGLDSTNIDPDISDRYVYQILDRCALEVIRNYGNNEDFPLAKDRIKN